MEKFFKGFEEREDEIEKMAMGAKIISGLRSMVQRVGNYFNKGVPKAIRNTQSGGAGLIRGGSTKPYPGIEAHNLGPIKTKIMQPSTRVRSNPRPISGYDYSSGGPKLIK